MPTQNTGRYIYKLDILGWKICIACKIWIRKNRSCFFVCFLRTRHPIYFACWVFCCVMQIKPLPFSFFLCVLRGWHNHSVLSEVPCLQALRRCWSVDGCRKGERVWEMVAWRYLVMLFFHCCSAVPETVTVSNISTCQEFCQFIESPVIKKSCWNNRLYGHSSHITILF